MRPLALAAALTVASPAVGQTVATQPWRVDMGASHSELSRGLADWSSATIALGRRQSRGSVVGALEWTRRFGQEDLFLDLRVDRRIGDGDAWVALGGAPDADHRPEASLRGGAAIPVSAGVSPFIELGWSKYAVGDVRTIQPGVAFAGGGWTAAGRLIATWDERDELRSGWSVRAGRSLTSRLTIQGSYADAPESSEGVTAEVQATALEIIYLLDDDAFRGVRGGLVFEDRGLVERTEISVSAYQRF